MFLDVQLIDSFQSVKDKLSVLFQLPPTSIQLWEGLNQVGFEKQIFLPKAFCKQIVFLHF